MGSPDEGERMLGRMESEVHEVRMERAIQQHGADQSASNAFQKLIEQKEKELRSSIMANYSRIKEVERELADLTVQLQVNVGPRKHALEMLRHKIEKQNEKMAKLRVKHAAAKKVLDGLDAELAREEAAKELLCSELGLLVQQSASAQLAKLEELKNHLDLLNRGVQQTNPFHTVGPPTAQSSSGGAPTDACAAGTSTPTPAPAAANGHAPSGPQGTPPATTSGTGAVSPDGDTADTANSVKVASRTASGSSAKSRASGKAGPSGEAGSGQTVANARDNPERQKLLAEVAAARAKQAAAAMSASSTPRVSGAGESPQRRAPAGASLMAAAALPPRQESGQTGANGSSGSRGSGQSRFAGFDT